jgi:hypothetical protein
MEGDVPRLPNVGRPLSELCLRDETRPGLSKAGSLEAPVTPLEWSMDCRGVEKVEIVWMLFFLLGGKNPMDFLETLTISTGF